MQKKSFDQLPWLPSSHKNGVKRVFLSPEETDTDITQIAVLSLKAGEEGEEHIHWKIEESFLVLSGEIEMIVSGQEIKMCKGDYLKLGIGSKHRLKAITDAEVLTVGCHN